MLRTMRKRVKKIKKMSKKKAMKVKKMTRRMMSRDGMSSGAAGDRSRDVVWALAK